MNSAESRKTFFRQSTWMMSATVVGGAMMFLVHKLNNRLPEGEYAAFGIMLQLLQWLAIPAVGLQMIFAQLAAGAVTDQQTCELHGAVRGVAKATFGLWLVFAVGVFFLRDQLATAWGLSSHWPLWVTLGTGLLSLWLPILMGLLQGRQNFLWMGWATIFNAAGRVIFSFLIVFLISATALGIMVGALMGMFACFAVALWESRSVWSGKTSAFNWEGWLRRLGMLTFGYGAYIVMFSTDVMLISSHFPRNEMDAYVAGGTLARAIVQFTAPLAAVMFPKIVQGLALSEKTDAFKVTVVGVCLLSGCAAVGLTVVSPYVFTYVFSEHMMMVPFMASFAWAMVPLAIANVLVNNLMAQSRFIVSPFLALVAVGYVVTLSVKHDSIQQVIMIQGGFNCLMLAVAAAFTLMKKPSSR